MKLEELKNYIRVVPDFPKQGVDYLDITTLLENTTAYQLTIDTMAERIEKQECDKLAAIEARGFIFAASLATKLKKPLVLIRKAGKLPGDVIKQTYDLEYGQDAIEVHKSSIKAHDKLVLIDDVLATGGTAKAACDLIQKLEAHVVGIYALMGLSFLPYKQLLNQYHTDTLLDY